MITFTISYLALVIIICIIFSIPICCLSFFHIKLKKEYDALLHDYERVIKKNEKLSKIKFADTTLEYPAQDKKETSTSAF